MATSSIARRNFVALAGGAATAAVLPLAAHAQQSEPVRRVGVLMSTTSDDPEGRPRLAAFLEGLRQQGWSDGRNIRVEARWTSGSADDIRKYAAELVALAPDVILASGSAAFAGLSQATRAVPIVFVHVVDPVGAGFVESLARPGGNATGFISREYGLGAKWLELLKQIAPAVKRVAVVRDSAQASGIGQFGAIQSVAPSFAVEVSPVSIRTAGEIERGLAAIARASNGGVIVTGTALATLHRTLLITLAARHRLPAVYFERYFVADGGLISYGPDLVDQYRRAANYVDRILKGEKAAELPVQLPTKYELAINLKTAKALGLTVPEVLLVAASELIE